MHKLCRVWACACAVLPCIALLTPSCITCLDGSVAVALSLRDLCLSPVCLICHVNVDASCSCVCVFATVVIQDVFSKHSHVTHLAPLSSESLSTLRAVASTPAADSTHPSATTSAEGLPERAEPSWQFVDHVYPPTSNPLSPAPGLSPCALGFVLVMSATSTTPKVCGDITLITLITFLTLQTLITLLIRITLITLTAVITLIGASSAPEVDHKNKEGQCCSEVCSHT